MQALPTNLVAHLSYDALSPMFRLGYSRYQTGLLPVKQTVAFHIHHASHLFCCLVFQDSSLSMILADKAGGFLRPATLARWMQMASRQQTVHSLGLVRLSQHLAPEQA